MHGLTVLATLVDEIAWTERKNVCLCRIMLADATITSLHTFRQNELSQDFSKAE